jgi:hypothetical protein
MQWNETRGRTRLFCRYCLVWRSHLLASGPGRPKHMWQPTLGFRLIYVGGVLGEGCYYWVFERMCHPRSFERVVNWKNSSWSEHRLAGDYNVALRKNATC